jgi:hypothetical protein
MATALSVLSSLGFIQLRPGENDVGFKFSGPGVVAIACQDTSCAVDEVRFKLITVMSADNDALEIATRLLKQTWNCAGYMFALLAHVPDKATRAEAVATLNSMCSAGT